MADRQESPGQSGNTPTETSAAPGQSGMAPGQSDATPGQSGRPPPGQSGATPGQSGSPPPGQSGATPGQSGSTPNFCESHQTDPRCLPGRCIPPTFEQCFPKEGTCEGVICPVGQDCAGKCVDKSCSTDADCFAAVPTPRVCENGVCVLGCTTPSDCAPDETCSLTPQVAVKKVTAHQDFIVMQITYCDRSFCLPKCHSDNDCSLPSLKCDLNTNKCVDVPGYCDSSDDCPVNSTCREDLSPPVCECLDSSKVFDPESRQCKPKTCGPNQCGTYPQCQTQDDNHCGPSCTRCAENQACQDGQCFNACDPGRILCRTGTFPPETCADPSTGATRDTAGNCACPAGLEMNAGTGRCECPQGETFCSSYNQCIDLSSPLSCGTSCDAMT
jgi:hypothetical protein